MLDNAPPALVSIMLANNETGAIQPVADAAVVVHAAGGLLHVDARIGVVLGPRPRHFGVIELALQSGKQEQRVAAAVGA